MAQLSASQWLHPDELVRHQFCLVRNLLAHARDSVPFYGRRFAEAGIVVEEITPDTFRHVPVLTREALQVEDVESNLTPRAHGRIFKTQTSGSSGQPVTVCGTGLTHVFWQAFTIRDHLWHQRDLSGKLAVIRYSPPGRLPPDGLDCDNWGVPTVSLYPTGPAAMLSIGTSLDLQMQWLIRQNPDILLTYPSNLDALLDLCLARGVRFPRLKEIRTISETLAPELRARCWEHWRVPVTDVYTSQEVGYMALQCPGRNHYHIQSEGVLVEILDEGGNPCRPGEIGRVVVTALHNYASPLIRYEIRDYAEVGPPCQCGRGLPVINRIVGRQRNMLTLPSGEKCWPITGFPRYKEVAPIRQFQFIQHSIEEVEMRLVSDRPLSVSEEGQLASIVNEGLGHPFKITFTRMPVIARGANGKFEEFVSRVSL